MFYKKKGENAPTQLGQFNLTGEEVPTMHVPCIGDSVRYCMHEETMSFAGQVRGRAIPCSSADSEGVRWGLCTRIAVFLETQPTTPTTLGDTPTTTTLQ